MKIIKNEDEESTIMSHSDDDFHVSDAPAIPPPTLANLPPVTEPEAAPEVQAEASADEPGTPVADEAEWPDKAPGEDFDMFNASPKEKAS